MESPDEEASSESESRFNMLELRGSVTRVGTYTNEMRQSSQLRRTSSSLIYPDGASQEQIERIELRRVREAGSDRVVFDEETRPLSVSEPSYNLSSDEMCTSSAYILIKALVICQYCYLLIPLHSSRLTQLYQTNRDIYALLILDLTLNFVEIAFYYWLIVGITTKESYETHKKIDSLKFVFTSIIGFYGINFLI